MTKELTKTELLLIRACKSKDPMKRLSSVYRRQYGLVESNIEGLVNILSTIIEKHHPISTHDLIKELSPFNSYRWENASGQTTYHEKALFVLVAHLRLAEITIFNGWVSPAPFRSKIKLVSK